MEDWYGIGKLAATTTLATLRHPDRCPSFSRIEIGTRGVDILQVIEIKGEHGEKLGALVISARGDPETGRLTSHGISLFTEEEIRYAGHQSDDAGIFKGQAPLGQQDRPEGHKS